MQQHRRRVMNNEDENLGKIPKTLRTVFKVIGNTTWATVFKYIIILGFTLLFFNIFNILNDSNNIRILEQAVSNATNQQKILDAKRDSSIYSLSDKIENTTNTEIEKLRLKLDGDRVFVTIFHDNMKMSSGIHFRFFSEGYERVDDEQGVDYIADNFQGIKTSLFPIFPYMKKHKFLLNATPDDVRKIDVKYSNRLKENNVKLIYIMFLTGNSGEDIGMLSISWLNYTNKDIPDQDKIKSELEKTGIKLESILDLTSYKNIKI